MKIVYPIHANGFYTLTYDEKKEAEIAGGEMMGAIIYLEN